jgi:hypothetical protein
MDLKLENLTEEQKENVLKLAEQIKQEEKKALYLKGHVASGISVGDQVKITPECVAESNGYVFTRIGQSRLPKGYIGEVTRDDKEKGFWVDGEHLCPYYVLEKIKEYWVVIWWRKTQPSEKRSFETIFKSREGAEKSVDGSFIKNNESYEHVIRKLNDL